MRTYTTKPIEDRLLENSHNEGNCRIYEGYITSNGYANIRVGSVTKYAHRVALECKLGRELLPGMDACHTRDCTDRRCIKFEHLYEGTRKENLADRIALGGINNGVKHQAAKTHCPKGHPYSGDNLRIYNGRRHCRACAKEAKTRYI